MPEAQSAVDDAVSQLQTLTDRLEACFNRIYRERMHDVPVINDKIQVAVVDLQHWQESFLGVLITPWFMNLILLPGDTENWDDREELTSTIHHFPSGRYSFLMAYEPEIGRYQSCSLFSPMFEFADHAAALETAEVVLRELMNSDNIEVNDIQTEQIEKIWHGEESIEEHIIEDATEANELEAGKDDHATQSTEPPPPSLTERMNQPMSRRQLLRGSFIRDEDVGEQHGEHDNG